jgi:hypothetical protein
VTIAGRTNVFYGEPVMADDKWTPLLTPWPTDGVLRYIRLLGRVGQRFGPGFARSAFDLLAELGRGDDIFHPGFNYSRFQVSYWQKFSARSGLPRSRRDPFAAFDMTMSAHLPKRGRTLHPLCGHASVPSRHHLGPR